MKNKYLFFICVVWTVVGYSQSDSERKKAISIIEDLSYKEFFLGNRCYYRTDINYEPNTGKIEMTNIMWLGKDKNVKTDISFYLDDVDVRSMKQTMKEHGGQYFVIVEFKSNGNSIKVHSVDTNKNEFSYPVSNTEYQNTVSFAPYDSFPKEMAIKYIENVKTLMGAE